MKSFIDTNIWIYLFGKEDQEKFLASQKLIKSVKAASSIQVINETCWNLLRKFSYTEKKIKTVIAHFSKIYLHPVKPKILLKASSLRIKYQFSFWDSLLIATALDAKCNVFYSEDLHHGLKVNGMVIINPFFHNEGDKISQGRKG